MQYFPAILLGILLIIIITRPFTVLFHELGHAIPAILITKQRVEIYVGSYGDTKYSYKVIIGKLNIWLRYNPIKWKGGLCVYKTIDIKTYQYLIILLGGSFSSFFIFGVFSLMAFTFDMHGSIKLVLIITLFSTIIDLYGNLVPREIKLENGITQQSDGFHIFKILQSKK